MSKTKAKTLTTSVNSTQKTSTQNETNFDNSSLSFNQSSFNLTSSFNSNLNTKKQKNPTTPKSQSSKSGPAKGLDSLLTTLSRPEKLSTISKTSADWDLFKSQSANSQLKEELESKAKGKEAYLVKEDFLNRVDKRRFEIEKGERERERAKRGRH